MRQKGFSLVELLVTITILGILSSLSLQLYKEYQDQIAVLKGKLAARDAYVALQAYMSGVPRITSDLNLYISPINGAISRYGTTPAMNIFLPGMPLPQKGIFVYAQILNVNGKPFLMTMAANCTVSNNNVVRAYIVSDYSLNGGYTNVGADDFLCLP